MDNQEKKRHRHLRGRLAEALGRETVPLPVWEVLVGAGHVREFEEGRITERKLVDYARALLLYADVVEQVESAPEQKPGKPVPEPPSFGHIAERARALAKYLELRVATHHRVLRFRRQWLGSVRPLSFKAAGALAEHPKLREARPGQDSTDDTTRAGGFLELFSGDLGECVRVDFGPGSGLGQLKEVSRQLREELFPLWSEAEAAWVIVTGKVKRTPQPVSWEVNNLTNDYLTHGTINLTIEPWVATDVVVKAYQWLQAGMLGRKPRALIQRNLRVVQFVMGELTELATQDPEDVTGLPKISWRRLVDRWNEANPEEPYDDERHLHRDFYRTAEAVVRPYEATRLDTTDANWMMLGPNLEAEE